MTPRPPHTHQTTAPRPRDSRRPHVLCINPYIHDFAAFDFWSKPLGLLSIAALLREKGLQVSYIDCMDRFHPRAPRPDPYARHGRGPFRKKPLPSPAALEHVDRTFSQYGIAEPWFEADLAGVPQPDVILVTASMTYWYTGVQRTIELVRRRFAGAPILLGGVYAALCGAHAQAFSGADQVVAGRDMGAILDAIAEAAGIALAPTCDADDPERRPYPAFDLQRRVTYVPLLTAEGCPCRCAYCASHVLAPQRRRRPPHSVFTEIRYWHARFGVCDFVIYDDAFLLDVGDHAAPLMEMVAAAGLPLRFHTPNALHIRSLTPAVARMLARAGFVNLRLGVETMDHRARRDDKVLPGEITDAIAHLHAAGFSKESIGAYLLTGLPHQAPADVLDSIERVRRLGIRPILAYYSPIPRTDLWPEAVAVSRYDLDREPLFTNNSLMPCWDDTAVEALPDLQRAARQGPHIG